MSILQDVILRSTRALQPAATSVPIGTLYFVTDESIIERSSGTVWESYSPASVAAAITQLTGDVTAGPGSGSQVATIGADKVVTSKILDKNVTYAKIQDVAATARILSRITAGAGVVEEATLSQVLDLIGSPAWGDILFRGTAGWQRLGAGSAGQILQTNGVGADPTWVAAGGGGGALSAARLAISEVQLEALGTTPLELVAAPAADEIIYPVQWGVYINITTGYTTSPSFQLRFNGSTAAIIDDIALTMTVSGRQVFKIEEVPATPGTWTFSVFDPRAKAINVQLTADPGTPGTGVGIAIVTLVYRTYVVE